MGKIIDGNKIADKILSDVRKRILEKDLNLKLDVILVGQNQISLSYISQKEKACEKAGVKFQLHSFPATIKNEDLKNNIEKISCNSSGLIIQLPLPTSIKTQEILNVVPGKKDIDVLSELSLGKFYANNCPLPPTIKAISCILSQEKVSLREKVVVVVGTGRLVGKPLIVWLISQGATILVANKNTSNIIDLTKKADVLISGTGVSGLINEKMIKRGAIVVDAGTSVEEGTLRGDINPEGISSRTAIFSPVPGGLGPITTACLIENLLEFNL